MKHSNGNGSTFPIPGAAGEAIRVALKSLSLHCGESTVIIRKERIAGGGYVYTIANDGTLARPALERAES